MEAGVGGGTHWGVGSRVCDVCKGSATAVFFCRADTSFLCGACDARVHGANKLSSRNERVLLCEVCEQSPAAVTCKADAAALCASCDADIHSANSLSSRHQRVPVVRFIDYRVSATAAGTDALYFCGDGDAEDCNGDAASWLLQEPAKDPQLEMGKSADCFFSEADPYLDLEYTSSVDAGIYQADRIVPAVAEDVIIRGRTCAGRRGECDCWRVDMQRREIFDALIVDCSVDDGSGGQSVEVQREEEKQKIRKDDPLRFAEGLRGDEAEDKGEVREEAGSRCGGRPNLLVGG